MRDGTGRAGSVASTTPSRPATRAAWDHLDLADPLILAHRSRCRTACRPVRRYTNPPGDGCRMSARTTAAPTAVRSPNRSRRNCHQPVDAFDCSGRQLGQLLFEIAWPSPAPFRARSSSISSAVCSIIGASGSPSKRHSLPSRKFRRPAAGSSAIHTPCRCVISCGSGPRTHAARSSAGPVRAAIRDCPRRPRSPRAPSAAPDCRRPSSETVPATQRLGIQPIRLRPPPPTIHLQTHRIDHLSPRSRDRAMLRTNQNPS